MESQLPFLVSSFDWTLPDPGDAGTLKLGRAGIYMLTIAGTQTRTLPNPGSEGEFIGIAIASDSSGSCAVTGTYITGTSAAMDDVGDCLLLVSASISGTLKWCPISNIGVTIS